MTITLPTGVLPGGRYAAWNAHPADYVLCDVDGTLIGPLAIATDEVVEAIARTQAAGVRVGFATGRMRDAVAPLLGQLGAVGPHVLHNGAEVRVEGTTLVSWTLTAPQIDALLGLADGRDDTYLEVYTESGFHVSSWDERARPHWEILGAEPLTVISAAAELDGAPVLKATFAAFDASIVEGLVTAIDGLGLRGGQAGSPRTPHLTYVNATHPEADKGHAVTRAADHLGIPLRAVAAVGDAANDLPMLAIAGTAVAMGQAPQVVRQAAHLIVPDVDAHGVAVALDAVVGWRVPR